MKITKISTAIVEANFQWTYVRIYTDLQGGLYGTGECFFAPGIQYIIQEFSSILIGEDFRNIGKLIEKMSWAASGAGSTGGIIINAITGIEAALFDLNGKYAGIPVYQFFGGKFRDDVRIYLDCHAGNSLEALDTLLQPHKPKWDRSSHHIAETMESILDSAPERAVAMANLGYDALKFDLDIPSSSFDSPTGYSLSKKEIDWMIELIHRVRDAVDDKTDLAFDAHWRYRAHEIIEVSKAAENCHLLWLEDPCPPSDFEGLKYLRNHSHTPIGTGENLQLMNGFQQLIEKNLADVITPDLQKVGGLLEGKKIADLAHAYNKPFAPHMIGSPIALMASCHLSVAVSNFLVCEFHAHDVPFFHELVNDSAEWFNKGRVTPLERPGFGIELNEKIVAKYLCDNSKLFA